MVLSGEVEGPRHDVLRGVDLLAEGLDLALGARTWSLSGAEVRGALVEVARQARRAQALYLALVAASVGQDDGATPGRETRQWLQHALGVSAGRARGDVENAALVDVEVGDLRAMGAALAAGQVGVEHVDAARRALAGIPEPVLAGHREAVDTELTRHAQALNGRDFATVAAHLAETLAPAQGEELDAFERERRFCEYAMTPTGVLKGTFRLEGRDAAETKLLLDHLSAPGADTDPGQGQLPGISDPRTSAQRRADALAHAVRLAASHPGAGTRAGEPPHLVIHTTVEQLAWRPAQAAQAGTAPPGAATGCGLAPLTPAMLQHAACDAVLQVVVLDRKGAVVEMRSPTRLATRAQRRALAARDRGCAFPGCGLPPSMCEAHHLIWWTRGGQTVIDNLVLLCARHHTEIHTGAWTVTMRDGVPWFTPPAWLDPDQTPLRNTLHDAVAAVTRLAQQLRLDIHVPATEAPPDDPDP